MIDALEARVDCFTMGVLSTLVANEINNTRRKNSPNKVSLLLIDRNLDLPVVSLFQEETVFDKINNLLPNLCPYSNDLRVDLRNFLFENKFKRFFSQIIWQISSHYIGFYKYRLRKFFSLLHGCLSDLSRVVFTVETKSN